MVTTKKNAYNASFTMLMLMVMTAFNDDGHDFAFLATDRRVANSCTNYSSNYSSNYLFPKEEAGRG